MNGQVGRVLCFDVFRKSKGVELESWLCIDTVKGMKYENYFNSDVTDQLQVKNLKLATK